MTISLTISSVVFILRPWWFLSDSSILPPCHARIDGFSSSSSLMATYSGIPFETFAVRTHVEIVWLISLMSFLILLIKQNTQVVKHLMNLSNIECKLWSLRKNFLHFVSFIYSFLIKLFVLISFCYLWKVFIHIHFSVSQNWLIRYFYFLK